MSKADPLNYIKSDPLYYDKHFPGVFEPMPECNGARWKVEHPELAKILPKAKSMADPNPPRKRKARPAPLPLRAPERAGDGSLIIPLPLPHAKLQPNRKNNKVWQETHHLAKGMRFACGLVAKQIAPPTPFKRARLDITTWTANKVDPANVWQWCKSAIDSLADAGIIVNDRDLECGEILGYYGKTTHGRRDMEFRVTEL